MAFNTAISGLNAAASELNVIGNNIANASTNGFKLARAEFSDVYPASSTGTASNAIGTGVKIAAVAQQFTQGNINFTNNNLDLAINGNGFFRLSDNGTIVYSRAGAYGVDDNGYIQNSNGQRLTGYLADATGTITGALGDLQLNTADIAPAATANIDVGVNLNAAASVPSVATFDPTDADSYNNATSLTVYDSLGAAHTATLYFVKNAVANSWDSYLYLDGGQVTQGGSTNPVILTFNNDGSIATVDGAGVSTVAFDAEAVTTGAADITMTLDFGANTPTTQFGSAFSVNMLSQDGYTTGRMSGVNIAADGIVYARYSNGQSQPLGQVVLTNFTNPQGMRPIGDTTWTESSDSGTPLTGVPGSSSLGLLQSGALEDSNVNLTDQLVRMITTQRNFQANAQVITTEDTITQTIINIR